MIKVVAKNIVKKDKVEEFIAITKELVEESRKEGGCIAYNLYQDINNSNILTFIEEWKDLKSVRLHNESNHFTTIIPKISDLLEVESEVNLYKRI